MPKFTPTIIAQHDQQAILENTVSREDSGLKNECWSIISDGISELFPMFFYQIDDDLFKLSEKAETNALQTLLFEAMRSIRREQENIKSQYVKGLSLKYDEYWNKPSRHLRVVDCTDKSNAGELSLIDAAVLDETLAVNGMIEKGNAMYQPQLFPLNKRFCFLSGKESAAEKLPVSPDVLCKQFSMIIMPMEVELTVKLLIYKMFDRQILGKLGSVYENLNSLLVARGVLPSIAHTIKKQTSAACPDEAGWPAQPPNSDETAQLSAYLETFRTMQSLMDGWRLQLGAPVLASAARSGASVADSEELINAIQLLQRLSNEDPLGAQPISAGGIKRQLVLQLGNVQGNNLGKTMGRPEEDIIDMMSMIFDYILDDKNLPAPVKGLIARLQIPIIKVAILDKSFFAKKNHASRVLLNDLAQAGTGLTLAEANADHPIMQKIEEVVTRIINEFNRDIALFDDLLKDFSAFMEKDSKRSMVAEKRTLQTTQSKEKVLLAKKTVASEITLRLQNVEAPAFFRTFIYNDWKDVLLLANLRRDKNDGEWERSLATLDKMIWSIATPANAQERLNLIREIPVIVKAIRDGLQSTSLDAHQIESLLKELEICHMDALHLGASRKRPEQSGQARDAEAILPTNDVNIKDPELAAAILEIKSRLPDISNIDVEEVVMGGVDACPQQKESNGLMELARDRHMEAANRLKVGDWIAFTSEDEHVWRIKLAWKSPATSLCVFVNRQGAKVLELKVSDLALRMRQGRAKVIEDANVPLMDRAVSFLTQSLQNPFAKPTHSVFYA